MEFCGGKSGGHAVEIGKVGHKFIRCTINK